MISCICLVLSFIFKIALVVPDHLHFQVHFRNSLFNFYYITAKAVFFMHCSTHFFHLVYFGDFPYFFSYLPTTYLCRLVLLTPFWSNLSLLKLVGEVTEDTNWWEKMNLNIFITSNHVETNMKIKSFNSIKLPWCICLDLTTPLYVVSGIFASM